MSEDIECIVVLRSEWEGYKSRARDAEFQVSRLTDAIRRALPFASTNHDGSTLRHILEAALDGES